MPNQTLDEKQLSRLTEAITLSENIMTDFRKQRIDALKEYLGSHYSNQGCSTHNPVNLLWLWVKIHMQSLAARQPRVLCSVPYAEHKPSAANLELALDVLMRRIRFGDSLRACVMEAMFGCGLMYTGLNESATVQVGGNSHKTGQPFCDPVFLDEAIFDLSARSMEQMQFIGHSYLMPCDEFEKCGLFDTSNMSKMTQAEKTGTGYQGTERSESLTTGGRSMTADYKKYYRLRNLWLPLDSEAGVCITIEDTQDGSASSGILREMEWNGPGQGPYRMLRFNEVPGNIMPLAPIANLIDLHRFQNSVFRKIEETVRNTKTILAYAGGAENDAERVLTADNLDTVRVDNVSNLKEISFNQIDQRLLAMDPMIRNVFSWFGGNLDTLGGLSPMSGTVGQDKLLSESASKQVSDMQRAVVDFTTDLVRDLAWWLWTDPLIHIPLVKRVRNTDIEIPAEFSAATRTGDFLDYNITIDPYSLQHSSPEMKLSAIQNFMNNVLPTIQPMMDAQGKTVDVNALVKLYGKYSDTPELYEIITSLETPIRPDAGPVGEAPAKAPVTTRNYVRTSRSAGATRPNRDNAMMQTLLGGGVQPNEMEAATGA